MLVQQQQLNLTTHARCFITLIKINDCQLTAMINFNATDNFIIRALVKKKEYST
jgi:hypothetical protein